MSKSDRRFIALDVHKAYIVVGAVNSQQEVVLPPRRVSCAQFESWAKKHLRPTDEIVLEATTNAWYVHDLLTPWVARVIVVHPYHVKLIASSMVKTDKVDTLVLACLLSVNILPAIWVPPTHVRELRALVAHRRRLVSQRSAAKNRLQSLLHRHNIVPPEGEIFCAAHRAWWAGLSISPSEKLRAQQDLVLLDTFTPLIEGVEAELARLSISPTWVDLLPLLIQLPGIGLLHAMTILSAIGDIGRFPSAKKLVGYAGLGARIHASGQTWRTGGITKQGRRELRATMIEAAWIAVRLHPGWRDRFERLQRSMGKQKAIVAIARKLLVVIWHVLTAQAADRQAEPEAVARSLMKWGTRHRLATSLGVPRVQFVRQHLDRLGIGQHLSQFTYCGHVYRLPPSCLLPVPA
jgi:transposase